MLSVEEDRQWEKSHMVSPRAVLAGWLRPEAAGVCKGPQTQIYPTGSQLSADPTQDLLYCFSGLDHEVVDLSCSLPPPAACCESTSCWANTHCLLFIACAISLLAAQLSAVCIIHQLSCKTAHVYGFVNENSSMTFLYPFLSWQGRKCAGKQR